MDPPSWRVALGILGALLVLWLVAELLPWWLDRAIGWFGASS